MSEQTMPFTANTDGLVIAVRNMNLTLPKAIMEIVDNSVDANATEVSIYEREDGALTIADNGEGCDDLFTAMTIGMSSKMNEIGRYGYGMKAACIKFSNRTNLKSHGKCLMVDWLEQNPTMRLVDCDDNGGMSIELVGFRRLYKGSLTLTSVRRAYSIAINNGLCIRLNGAPLEPVPFPSFINQIDVTMEYDGKPVRVRGGIYKSDDPQRKHWNGYNVFYRGRLVGDGKVTQHGTGDSFCSSFCFVVEVDDAGDNRWTLTTHKDEIEDMAGLLDYIYQLHTKAILDSAADMLEELDLSQHDALINDILNGGIDAVITRNSAPRNPNGEGAKPTGKGSRKRRSKTGDGRPGRYIEDGGPRKKCIGFKIVPLDGLQICNVVDMSKTQVVELNSNNAFVKLIQQEQNTLAKVGIILMAWSTRKCASMGEFSEVNILKSKLDPIFNLAGAEMNSAAERYANNDAE